MSEENNEISAEVNPGGETTEVKTSAEAVTVKDGAGSAASAEVKKPARRRPAKKSVAQTGEQQSVQFVGKQKRWNKKLDKQETVLREAPAFVIDGRKKIMLPAGLDKGVALDSDTAQRVKTLFPEDFKTPTAK